MKRRELTWCHTKYDLNRPEESVLWAVSGLYRNPQQIADYTGYSVGTVYRAMARLKRKGYMTAHRVGGEKHYAVPDSVYRDLSDSRYPPPLPEADSPTYYHLYAASLRQPISPSD